MFNYCFPNLRAEMRRRGYIDADVCEVINKSQSYVSKRLSGSSGFTFTIQEGYLILDWLELPHERFTDFFGPGQLSRFVA